MPGSALAPVRQRRGRAVMPQGGAADPRVLRDTAQPKGNPAHLEPPIP